MGSSKPRFVLIIGASGWLGSKISSLFLRQGNHVALHYHKRRSPVEKLFKEALKPPGNTPVSLICQCNLEDRKSLDKMFQTIGNRWPSLDVVVNSAGLIDDLPAIRMSEDRWDSVLNVNLTGPFLCMRMSAEIMIRGNGGHIINIGSLGGVSGRAGQANYAAAKAGLIGLTRSAAREWAGSGIQVNAVLPGWMPSRLGLKTSPLARQKLISENLLGAPSTAEEVGQFVYHLSGMKHVSGQVFNLDSRIP